MKSFKVFLGVLSAGFGGIFLILSNYFFEYFYYPISNVNMFYVSLVFLVLAIVGSIILLILVLKDKKVITKLYCTVVPLTLILMGALYFLFLDTNKDNIVRLISSKLQSTMAFGGINFETMYFIIAIYVIILLLVITLTISPIKKVQKAITVLGNGHIAEDIKIGTSREFKIIEQGLNKINSNYKQSRVMFERLNEEYSKYLPQQFVKELGKKSVLDLSLGCNIQKEVTSVFIDIRNSTKTSYTLSLSDNFNFINKYLGIIGPIVRKNNGYVDKYLGDGVLAIFIKPEVALRACAEIIKTINSDSKALGIYNTKIGVGIHTGVVLMGVIGDKKRLSGTVIAESVNSAAYLEKLNRVLGTSMLFTKNTLNALPKDCLINYRYVGSFELGVDNKVPIFESIDVYEDKKKVKLLQTKSSFENAVRNFELGGSTCKKVFLKCIEQEKTDGVAKYYLGQITVDKEL